MKKKNAHASIFFKLPHHNPNLIFLDNIDFFLVFVKHGDYKCAFAYIGKTGNLSRPEVFSHVSGYGNIGFGVLSLRNVILGAHFFVFVIF